MSYHSDAVDHYKRQEGFTGFHASMFPPGWTNVSTPYGQQSEEYKKAKRQSHINRRRRKADGAKAGQTRSQEG